MGGIYRRVETGGNGGKSGGLMRVLRASTRRAAKNVE